MTFEDHQKRRTHISRSLLIAALGLFLTAAALAVVKPSAPPEPIYQAHSTLDLRPLAAVQPGDADTAPYIHETRIRRGDTVAAVLQRLGVDEAGLLPFLIQDKGARSIYKLYPGRNVQAALDGAGDLIWLRYAHTPGTQDKASFVSRWLEVRPDGHGSFLANERSAPTQTQLRIAQGEITSSLFGAADQAGLPDAVTMGMVEILGSRIDFLKDLRKGDRFRIVYDAYSHDGEEVGTGRIRALEFTNGKKVYSAVWYRGNDDAGGYYDFEGASLKGAFLRSALKFTRISSRFGMRMHPVHNRWIGHKGVDYAAPTGTPIHATADGVVEFIGRQNGYGNVIILKNHGAYSTLYAHQSRFAKGLKKGARVQQGQLIGYVGSTGWATGPHLHYEFRVNKKPIDPLSVDLPVARKLEAGERKAFDQLVAQYRTHIDYLARMQEQDPAASQRVAQR